MMKNSVSKKGMVVSQADDLALHGFAQLPDLLGDKTLCDFRSEFDRQMEGDVVGTRKIVFSDNPFGDFAQDAGTLSIIKANSGQPLRLVRIILFNKTPSVNWSTSWHQDRSIAVQENVPCAGFDNWAMRPSGWQVEAPPALLEKMLTLRIQLDPTGLEVGAVQFIPGSHRHGRLTRSEMDALGQRGVPEIEAPPEGTGFLMRPLLVHSSSRMSTQGQRRVVHLEFGPAELPAPLEWRLDHPDARLVRA